jgi:hypothetical protein
MSNSAEEPHRLFHDQLFDLGRLIQRLKQKKIVSLF